MLHRLIQWIDDPPPALAFEITGSGIAWSVGDQFGFEALPLGTVRVSPQADNIVDPAAFSAALQRVVPTVVSRKRRPCALILPDHGGRITVLDFDTFPSNAGEQAALVRFRVKKSLPFDADSAALSFQAQQSSKGRQEVVVAAISLEILSHYESMFRAAGLHPGYVTLSSLASLELVSPASGVVLAARLNERVLTLMLLTGGVLRLTRCVELAAPTMEEAAGVIFPTMAYAEDEFGSPVESVVQCGFDAFVPDWPSAFTIPVTAFHSKLRPPTGADAGLLGYLEAMRAA